MERPGDTAAGRPGSLARASAHRRPQALRAGARPRPGARGRPSPPRPGPWSPRGRPSAGKVLEKGCRGPTRRSGRGQTPRFRGRTGGALAPTPPVLLAARDSFAPRRRPRCVIPSCDPPAVSPRVPRPGRAPDPDAPPGGLSLGHATPRPGETRRAAPRGFHGRLCVLQPRHRRSLFFVTIDF